MYPNITSTCIAKIQTTATHKSIHAFHTYQVYPPFKYVYLYSDLFYHSSNSIFCQCVILCWGIWSDYVPEHLRLLGSVKADTLNHSSLWSEHLAQYIEELKPQDQWRKMY